MNMHLAQLVNKGTHWFCSIMGGVEAFAILGIFIGPVIFNVVSSWINKSLETKS